MEDPTQRNQIMDRSFPNFDSGIKTPVYDGRGKNNYMDRSFEKQTPPIQNNEFLSALDSDEP